MIIVKILLQFRYRIYYYIRHIKTIHKCVMHVKVDLLSNQLYEHTFYSIFSHAYHDNPLPENLSI